MTSKAIAPLKERPDLSPYLIHLTKATGNPETSAFENLLSILKSGKINASTTASGFIKGPNTATCLMDVPISSLKYLLNKENMDPVKPRYAPFGVLITKDTGYKKGCRPVLYMSDEELEICQIPKSERWRVVRFEFKDGVWLSWQHEREWRCKGALRLPESILAVLVETSADAKELSELIHTRPGDFKTIPKSIIPISVVCHGLIY